MTNLRPTQGSANSLLAGVRRHRAIENRFHWRRDVTDAAKITVKCAKERPPRVLAVLNSFLLALLDFLGVGNVPKQMRLFAAHPQLAVRLLLGSPLTFK